MKVKIESLLSIKGNKAPNEGPQIFDLRRAKDKNTVTRLYSQKKIQFITDDYREQQKELFAINNPKLVYTPNFTNDFVDYIRDLEKKIPLWNKGNGFFFPGCRV